VSLKVNILSKENEPTFVIYNREVTDLMLGMMLGM